ncbi:MAG: GTP pyrophosphokinase family protein [Anaerotignaceae bacterium]
MTQQNSSMQLEQDFYGSAYPVLEETLEILLNSLKNLSSERKCTGLRDPIEHSKARIKTAASMVEKLDRKNLPLTCEAALTKVFDAVGIRVICTFMDDVYLIANMLRAQPNIEIVEEKNYISTPKPNGYRSYHMIVKVMVRTQIVYAEIQIRTIAMDCWASLEHQLKYKHDIQKADMFVAELKRCADEIASTDITLQTIRDLINETN